MAVQQSSTESWVESGARFNRILGGGWCWVSREGGLECKGALESQQGHLQDGLKGERQNSTGHPISLPRALLMRDMIGVLVTERDRERARLDGKETSRVNM